jgi:hypothetical protein
MVKRKHSSEKRGKVIRHVPLSEEDNKTEKILIENFVALQRVMTNLSERFDSLATQISKMLNLFEISAKALAEKEFSTEKDTKDVKIVVEKLDGLLEQNKTIARGLLMLHENNSPTNAPEQHQEENTFSSTPTFPPSPNPTPSLSSERYQKSISSEGGELQPPRYKPLPK